MSAAQRPPTFRRVRRVYPRKRVVLLGAAGLCAATVGAFAIAEWADYDPPQVNCATFAPDRALWASRDASTTEPSRAHDRGTEHAQRQSAGITQCNLLIGRTEAALREEFGPPDAEPRYPKDWKRAASWTLLQTVPYGWEIDGFAVRFGEGRSVAVTAETVHQKIAD